MRTLALDAASRVTGYAVLDGLAPSAWVEAGTLKGSEAQAVVALEPAELAAHLSAKPYKHIRRIHSLIDDIEALVAEATPDRIVVEIPSGLAGTASKVGPKALATYGLAAGAIYLAARTLRPGATFPVTEREWTPGQGKKDARKFTVATLYPGLYDPAQDTDAGDAADAVLLARWFITRHPAANPKETTRV